MKLNSHQLTESLLEELEKEAYYYYHQQGNDCYDFEKANIIIKKFFKYHKLKTTT